MFLLYSVSKSTSKETCYLARYFTAFHRKSRFVDARCVDIIAITALDLILILQCSWPIETIKKCFISFIVSKIYLDESRSVLTSSKVEDQKVEPRITFFTQANLPESTLYVLFKMHLFCKFS